MGNKAKHIYREFSLKPTLPEYIVFCAGVLCFTPFANKFLLELLSSLSLLSFFLAKSAILRGQFLLWRICLITWMLALLSPIDIVIRSGDALSIAWVNIYYGSRTQGPVDFDDIKQFGDIKYFGSSFLVPCRYGILIVYKSATPLETPLFSFLKHR